MNKQTNPAGRVDVLVERSADFLIKRFVETHPLHERLKVAGIALGEIMRGELARKLKHEKITDVKSLRRALRR